MNFLKRTCCTQDLNKTLDGSVVVLNGWVHRLRDHGPIVFINLRDRSGLAQCIVDENAAPELKAAAKSLKNEYCIAIEGRVRLRPQAMRNSDMASGDVEISVEKIVALTECLTPPFVIEEDKTNAKEELRLKYRYLDLRSGAMQRHIKLRHQAALAVRNFLAGEGFYEVETPVFMKSTPEGARDYVVPSRIYPGKFFALPQSPQLYKQILMVGGIEKYFQIARCFRDEDPRGDRQPEFTQIDIEMSFVEQDDVLAMTERLYRHLFSEVLNVKLPVPFQRLTYREAINRYGSDKPDLRFALELCDFSETAAKSSAGFLQEAACGAGQTVKALIVPHYGEALSRKKAQELEELAKAHGANGLAWIKKTAAGLEGGAAKFFAGLEDDLAALGLEEGGAALIAAGAWQKTCAGLGAVRVQLGKELHLTAKKEFAFCWIVDFPMFEWSEEEAKWQPAHHMFTMPQEQFLGSLEQNPDEILGCLYDLVLNGYELASGSIRIHDPRLQKRIFAIAGYSEAEAEERFGFLLEAFKYGAPPHGGIAHGFDRLVMLMAGEETIREVIAFPKNTQGLAPMENAPAAIGQDQLNELHLALKVKDAKD